MQPRSAVLVAADEGLAEAAVRDGGLRLARLTALLALGTPLAALWTEFADWRMVFWQIVPLGIACCAAIGYGLPADTPKPERLRAFNWSGFLTGFPAVAMLVVALLHVWRRGLLRWW